MFAHHVVDIVYDHVKLIIYVYVEYPYWYIMNSYDQ